MELSAAQFRKLPHLVCVMIFLPFLECYSEPNCGGPPNGHSDVSYSCVYINVI